MTPGLLEISIKLQFSDRLWCHKDIVLFSTRFTNDRTNVAIDGISLTVISLDSKSFSVAIIPHTLIATNLGSKNKGDSVNIEIDIIGKYVEKFLGNKDNSKGLESLLKEEGFTD